MTYRLLDKINSPTDLKSLDTKEILDLADEIRDFLIKIIDERGGHLASNLGVVELTLAIHKLFDSPADHVIFDVGHQSYVHKLLTGRRDRFDELRLPGGLSGFTSRRESEHDPFGAGHSSTSLSAALGFAEADKLSGKDSYTVCVVGDGAYSGGMIHEAINNCKEDLRLIVVLNENGMSISPTKGAFASYLSGFRSSYGYIGVKERTENLLSHIPLIGKPIKALLSFLKNSIKRLIFKTNYFEDLGFYYLGPIDGNDYKKVERALAKAKRLGKCVFVHLKTIKGKGCEPAESSPEDFHSLHTASGEMRFHAIATDELIKSASTDEKVVAITAAMGQGTGLSRFEEAYPDRYFDVGIAEPHALTFSAGLSAGGYKPYCAIYSTFLQRAYDNVIHDIALQELPVRLLVDRAGISVKDGATHHGIFDVSFLSSIPGVEIISPAFSETLRCAVDYSLDVDHPLAIRYPNLDAECLEGSGFGLYDNRDPLGLKLDFDEKDAPERIFVTYGSQLSRVRDARDLLSEDGIMCGIIIAERIRPAFKLVSLLEKLAPGRHIVFAEEGIRSGGVAETVMNELASRGVLANSRFDIAAIEDSFLIPEEMIDIYEYAGIGKNSLRNYFR